MNTPFKKIINDIRLNYTRTGLVVLGLILGLVGAGSVAVSYTIATRDLNENFLRTKPFHVEITSGNFEELSLDTFRKKEAIESAEFRDLSRERIEVFPGKWVRVSLHGVEDFNEFHLAEIFFEGEEKHGPIPGTMFIERDGQKISDITLHGTPALRVGNGQYKKVPVSGFVFDPAQSPATQDEYINAYVDKKTFREITGKKSNNRLIYRVKNGPGKAGIENITLEILAEFEKAGIIVDKVIIPQPETHPHQWQMNTLLTLEGSIGFLALLMGSVMVWQLISATLTQQTRQIGILKAIGATRRQVFTMYLFKVIILGVIAGLISIPLAVKIGYAFAGFVAIQLNFDILTTSLPGYLYVWMGAAALILPVVTSLPALLKGTRVSAWEATNDYGIQPTDPEAGISKLPFSSQVTLAVRDILIRKKKLALIVIMIGLGAAIFNTGFNVRQSIRDMLNKQGEALNYDVQLTLSNPVPMQQALAPFSDISPLKKIEARGGATGVLQTSQVETTAEATVFALPWDTDLFRPEIIKGRWLLGNGQPEVVINQKVQDTFEGAGIGQFYLLNVDG
ncbi:MAG: ABC transporter permease, partial [Cyclobacteriaceae bacterium]|nr:ABC transporter permease [Cyclobacteriaceae bacterium]